MKVEANYGCSARKDGIFDQSYGGTGKKVDTFITSAGSHSV